MNIKIRKLIFSCAVGCSCLWFPVSAFADWILTDVLLKINQTHEGPPIEECDLEHRGILEIAREILQEEKNVLIVK